jgi:mRNA degradation ribonuclease J1/J2
MNMMKVSVYTWGTGGAFGRIVGLSSSYVRRHQASASIIGADEGETRFHFLIDAGSPCVETMIDNDVPAPPDVVFITHSHTDHVSDFDKLANIRIRNLMMLEKPFASLPVICTRPCLDDPNLGLKSKFGYLGELVRWVVVPAWDVWYSIRTTDGALLPSLALSRHDFVFPMEFKALPVHHALAPGACLFIFRLRHPAKRIVVSGDFESIEDRIIETPDLKDPDLLLLDCNALKAVGINHGNWEQNKELIRRWVTGRSRVHVLLTHIAGFEDCQQGYYDHMPTEADWEEGIKSFAAPANTMIELAKDGKRYPV